ncbi:UNVERIFIED_CONTAM: hypothetical protein NCL1_22887 [Trichonephila clavipes]
MPRRISAVITVRGGRRLPTFVLGFQEYDEEDVETWMACDAEDCKFQMQNDDEIVTSVQEESDPVGHETDEDEENTTKVARVHQMLTRILHYRQPWSGRNNNQSSVLFNNCFSRESETKQKRRCTMVRRKISDYFPQ